MKKWRIVNELLERLDGRNFHDFLTEDLPEELIFITHAPHISHRAWILKYKGVYMCFMDTGNGWWNFYSVCGYFDVLIAKFEDWKAERRKCKSE